MTRFVTSFLARCIIPAVVLAGCERKHPASVEALGTSAAGTYAEIKRTHIEVPMTKLDEARAHTAQFEKAHDTEALRQGYEVLENVSIQDQREPEARHALRAEVLRLWLRMLSLLDQTIDPHFDPKDVPSRVVQPPPTKGGVVFPPGVEPERIDDPAARAQYEKAIAANQAKIDHYRLQVELRRLDERITPRAERFIHDSYTSDPRDLAELRVAIDQSVTNPTRKTALSKLVSQALP
jgi:hypothetical protein